VTAKILGESVEFRIEVEDSPRSVLLVLDRKCSIASVPWQDAYRLAEVIDQVIADVRDGFKPTDYATTVKEQGQVKLNHGKDLVHLFVEWTDRLRFTSLDALYLFEQALKKVAQDAQYEARGVHFRYGRSGMLTSVHNTKTDTVQKVRDG
jgi:hypothetical protein